MVNKNEQLAPLLSALRSLMEWFSVKKVRGVVIGGVAASLLGRPRFTRDIDALVLLDIDFCGDFLSAGEKFGFVPRRAGVLNFAKKNRILLVRHNPSSIDIDISLGALPFEEEAVSRAKMLKISGIKVSLPSPEDLIIMKAVANRPQDQVDIESILDVYPSIDTKRILKWAREFALVLELPEILSGMKEALARRKK